VHEPELGSAKKILPANRLQRDGRVEAFGALLCSPLAEEILNGGVCCGLGAGRPPRTQHGAHAMNKVITRLTPSPLGEFTVGRAKFQVRESFRSSDRNHTMRIGSGFRVGVEGIKALQGGFRRFHSNRSAQKYLPDGRRGA